MLKRFSCLLLAIISTLSLAQNTKTPQYVSLEDTKVYDVEIIVFAYNSPLPNGETYTNKNIFDDADAYQLDFKPEDLPLITENETLNDTDVQTKLNPDNPNYTIAIDESVNSKKALVWFEWDESNFQLTKIWQKLQTQQNIIPLVHRAWRQAETPFQNPQYVKLTTLSIEQKDEVDTDSDFTSNTETDPNINTAIDAQDSLLPMIYPDYTILGKVALSKGRYLHFGHKLNLLRGYQTNEFSDTKNMVFSLVERKQLKPDELHYFDTPWFGTLVKITEVNGELPMMINESGENNDNQ
jgi:hypothetical protein